MVYTKGFSDNFWGSNPNHVGNSIPWPRRPGSGNDCRAGGAGGDLGRQVQPGLSQFRAGAAGGAGALVLPGGLEPDSLAGPDSGAGRGGGGGPPAARDPRPFRRPG